jgi:sugar lactone lactonase YvrE
MKITWGTCLVAVGALALGAAGCGGSDGTPSVVMPPPAKVRSTPPCAGPGTICTLAGNGDAAFTGEGEAALATSLYWPVDLEIAPDGRPYILDWQNHRVRRLDTDGKLRTVVGTDSIGDGPDPGGGNETVAPGIPGTTINLNHPTDIQFTRDGATMYLASWHNHKIRQLDVSSGNAVVTCGKGPGFAGDGMTEDKALFSMPKSIALAPTGDLFVVDTRNLRVRRVGASHMVDTVAGTGMRGATGDGGDRLAATFSFQKDGDNPEPGGAIALDAQGRLYVADTQNNRVRRFDLTSGLVETVAGDGTRGAGGDGGPAKSAQLGLPQDIEIGPDGRLYIADTENHVVRAVDLTTGIITRVAGSGQVGDGGDGGDAKAASLNRPFGIAFDADGNLYVADTLNNLVRKVVKP